MKTKLHYIFILLACSTFNLQISTARAQGTAFTYQGFVTSGGSAFTGAGQFQFALVTSTNNNHTATGTANLSAPFITSYNLIAGGNGYVSAPTVTISGGGGTGATATANLTGGVVTSLTPGSAGTGYTSAPTVTLAPPPPAITYTTYWSNDGTSVNGSEPAASVSVAVTNGLFTVVPGDTTQPNMAAIRAALFNQPDLQLRIWFNDGTHGFAALNPAQSLTPVPYAAFATTADNLNNGLTVQPNGDDAPNVIGGSSVNFVTSGVEGATIGGGGTPNFPFSAFVNSVTANFGTVSGGVGNTASGPGAFGGGGGVDGNAGYYGYAVSGNTASGGASVVVGGLGNQATNSYATVPGGAHNTAGGSYATVGGGNGNTASGGSATVSGGSDNVVSGTNATVGGGAFNKASGPGAFVGGGGYDGNVSGNTASGAASVVAGGLGNQATNFYATVPGGANNTAGGSWATVSGGTGNSASGNSATIPGGAGNVASGQDSFAAGNNSHATDNGSFVWGDGTRGSTSQGSNTFNVLATGGVYCYTLISGESPYGAYLAKNSTAWSAISDRNAKKNFQPVDAKAVLNKLAAIPISEWNYKWEKDSDVPNIGPMAQDFKHAFYPGRDDKGITTLEFDGVELAAIQGLNQKLNAKDAEIQTLKTQNDSLAQRLNELEAAMKQLAEKK